MDVAVITPPDPVVSLDQVKRQCRLAGFDDDDQLLVDLIATACAWIDGPGAWLGRAVGLQTIELRLDGFYEHHWGDGRGFAWSEGWWSDWGRWPFQRQIKLPYPPLVSVTSITYEDYTGADQTLTSSGWKATDEGVEPSWGMPWPSGRVEADAVRIRYQAGYAPGKAPMAIQHAVLLLVSHWYNHSDAVVGVENRDSSTELPLGVADLLGPYRVWA